MVYDVIICERVHCSSVMYVSNVWVESMTSPLYENVLFLMVEFVIVSELSQYGVLMNNNVLALVFWIMELCNEKWQPHKPRLVPASIYIVNTHMSLYDASICSIVQLCKFTCTVLYALLMSNNLLFNTNLRFISVMFALM